MDLSYIGADFDSLKKLKFGIAKQVERGQISTVKIYNETDAYGSSAIALRQSE